MTNDNVPRWVRSGAIPGIAVFAATHDLISGVDEAGRGPLAGPVVAAAVILDPQQPVAGLRDSKQLSAKRRDELAIDIRQQAIAYAIGAADVAEIDQLNILQATYLAMRRAVFDLPCQPARVDVDGNSLPDLSFNGGTVAAQAIVGGDRRVAEISAASILAKVARDEMMCALDTRFPEYGFRRHKGYGTRAHLAALEKHGPCAEHRHSFRPVSAAIAALKL